MDENEEASNNKTKKPGDKDVDGGGKLIMSKANKGRETVRQDKGNGVKTHRE